MKNLLSVIIPCYNNGRYLTKMIDCFKNQTVGNWELIIVDDLSTDDTPSTIREYIRDMDNIFFYTRDRLPKGSAVCRNIGFEKSKGEYVCHIDADDLVSNTFVQDRVAYMNKHTDIDYASFPAKLFTDEKKLPSFYTPGYTWGVPLGNKPLLYYFLKYKYPFSVWNNIYRKDSIKDLPWDEKVLIKTDFSFIVPTILKGLKHSFSNLNKVDYYYRHDINNKVAMTSDQVSPEKLNSTIYLFSKTLDSIKECGLYNEYKNVFFEYVLIYFQEILFRETENGLEDYIGMCEKYYSKSQVKRMRILKSVYFRIKHHKPRMAIFLILGFVFFQKMQYLKTLAVLLRIL